MKKILVFILFALFHASLFSQSPFTFHKKLSTWGMEGVNDNVGFNSISFSQDENYLAAAGDLGSFLIWDLKTGTVFRNLQEQSDESNFFIRSVNYSPDGKYLIAAGAYAYQRWESDTVDGNQTIKFIGQPIHKKMIRVYNCKDYSLKKEISYDTTGEILSSSFSPDSKRLIVGDYSVPGSKQQMRMFNTSNWKELSSVNTENVVWKMDFTALGNRLFTGDEEGNICLWEVKGKKLSLLAKNQLSDSAITYLSLSPNGKWMSINGNPATIYEGFSRKHPHVFDSISPTYSACFSKDSNYIGFGDDNNKCTVWDAKTFQKLQSLQGDVDIPERNEDGFNFTDVLFSYKSKYLAMVNDGGIIYIYKRE